MKREIELFLDFCSSEKNLVSITLESYEYDLGGFTTFLKSHAIENIEQLQDYHVKQWIYERNKIREEEKKAIATTRRSFTAVKQFLTFLYNEDLCAIDPNLIFDMGRHKWEIPEVITTTQVENLLMQPNTKTLFGLRDAAMLQLCYDTGVRVSELIKLQKEHFRPDFLKVIGNVKKNVWCLTLPNQGKN